MKNLRVSIIQTDLVWEDKAANLGQFDKKLAEIGQESDLVVLPEMFTTGFTMHPESLAETPDGNTTSWLKLKAISMKAVIVGSLIVKEAGKYYNRLIWANPDGTVEFYDKHHLFGLAGESENYTPGNKQLITQLQGWTFKSLICYDLRFPVWARNTEGYQVLIYIANWPRTRAHHWKTLLTARAIENQAYVVGVNRIGTDGNHYKYQGDSGIVSPQGEWLVSAEPGSEITMSATLNYTDMQAYRQKFPFLDDVDSFSFGFS